MPRAVLGTRVTGSLALDWSDAPPSLGPNQKNAELCFPTWLSAKVTAIWLPFYQVSGKIILWRGIKEREEREVTGQIHVLAAVHLGTVPGCQ